MEVISIIVMFVFGNMNDTEDRLTQYVPMESLSSCMKEVRLLKRDKKFQKDAFCSPSLVEMKDGKVVTLHSALPEGAVMVDKEVSKQALKEWTLRSKEKWEKSKD